MSAGKQNQKIGIRQKAKARGRGDVPAVQLYKEIGEGYNYFWANNPLRRAPHGFLDFGGKASK